MKKLIINTVLFLVVISTLVSCKKDIADKYYNPDKAQEASPAGLFTAMLNNDRIAAKYWNVRTFLSQMPGVYAQTTYISNSNTIYRQNDGYSQNYWDDFYSTEGNGSGAMALYRAMQSSYSQLSPTDQANQAMIMEAAKVVVIEQAAKMVDLWGDIPYTEAGSLETSGTIKAPKFDEQKALYTSFISDLTAAATYFKANPTNKDFSKADILLKGNVDLWARYVNSLKLRLLMRISRVDENTARTAVLEMLNNPAAYPLADGNNNPLYSPGSSDILLQPLITSTSDLHDAFFEGSWYATDYMLNTVMLPANDPRIPVIYDKFGRTVKQNGVDVFIPNPTYRAMPVTFSTTEQDASFPDYAVLDSATFVFNRKLPGIVITASEVNLLKAEAYERWGSTTSAKTAYDNALKQSVAFYHYLNNVNDAAAYVKVPAPAPIEVDTWVNTSTAAYTGTATDKLAKIYTQKWVHLGVLQSIEAWSEYRRTGYPVLTFPSNGKLAGFETPPVRLLYPAKEKTLNAANYQAVQGKDTRTTKIFWQP